MRFAPSRATRLVSALLLSGTLLLTAAMGFSSVRWIGRPFPGFFLLRNRVIASVDLPTWHIAAMRHVFQSSVVAVDGVPVHTAADVYERVRAKPAGTDFTYALDSRGQVTERVIASQTFTSTDWWLVFGVYLFNGLVFAAIGIGVWVLGTDRATTSALLALGLCFSMYALSAVDLYGPHHLFRVYAVAEAFLPAVIVHLALLFPMRRTAPARAMVISYVPAVLLTAVAQVTLDSPYWFTVFHLFATCLTLAAGLYLVYAAINGYLRSPSELVRNRVRVAVLGLLLGFVLPVLVLSFSVIDGAKAPANLMGFTTFLFPLSIAYAVYKRDLFEIDALVRRGTYYALFSAVVTGAYLGGAALANHFVQISTFGQSQALSLGLTLAILIVMPGVRDSIQRCVDALFGRNTYDAQEVLASASGALGATLDLENIQAMTLAFPARVLGLEHASVFLRTGSRFEEVAFTPEPRRPGRTGSLSADCGLVSLLETALRAVVRDTLVYPPVSETVETLEAFDALGAELIVPIACQSVLIGFLVCGPRSAGTFFTAEDISFLQTFANQAALSLQNACTVRDLHVLNADLERHVEERTQQLATYNTQLESAYATLQSSQEQLIAAQKMAAFGRLAAQIAHEMATPLGAALNHFKSVRDILGDCTALVVDGSSSVSERQAAIDDLAGRVAEVEEWTKRAVAYLRSVKAHSRNNEGALAPFDIGRLVERDLQPLLMHRLRLAGGGLDVHVAPDVPELYGDSGRLGQVLANLINNAIDASEGLPPERARIRVTVDQDEHDVVVLVSDRGTGIPEPARDRIFEEFYTTKPSGKGTGLGLSIARDIVTGEFAGTLACTESSPEGTTFTIRIPIPFSNIRRENPGRDYAPTAEALAAA